MDNYKRGTDCGNCPESCLHRTFYGVYVCTSKPDDPCPRIDGEKLASEFIDQLLSVAVERETHWWSYVERSPDSDFLRGRMDEACSFVELISEWKERTNG